MEEREGEIGEAVEGSTSEDQVSHQGGIQCASQPIKPSHVEQSGATSLSTVQCGTLDYILSCCSEALGEGRYGWRHQVLKAIAKAIVTGVEGAKPSRLPAQAIIFIRAGAQPRLAAKTSAGILVVGGTGEAT